MFFKLNASLLHTYMETIIDCAHMKWNSHVNLMNKSSKIWKTMKKGLSFIFHLFVKSLINISDLCTWPLYWNFVEFASSASRLATPPRGALYERRGSSQLDWDRCAEFLWCWRGSIESVEYGVKSVPYGVTSFFLFFLSELDVTAAVVTNT